MKTLAVLFALFIFGFVNSESAQPKTDNQQGNSNGKISLSNNFMLGIRFLKLGNTWREAGDLKKCERYLNTGYELIVKFGKNDFYGKYHKAQFFEFMGYLERDRGDYESSKYNFTKAKRIYDAIINMEDGSQDAMDAVISIESDRAKPGLKNSSNENNEDLEQLRAENEQLIEKNKELRNKIDMLMGEVKSIKNTVNELEKAISDLKNSGPVTGY